MMAKGSDSEFPVLLPDLQVSFYYRLEALRGVYLRDAMKRAVSGIEISALDKELTSFVSHEDLRHVASFGLRGEVFFPVPLLLQAEPFLLGYYRLLYGLSQKAFYNKGPFGRFKRLEEGAEMPPAIVPGLPALCRSLVQTASQLIAGLDELSWSVVHDLQVLTIGPQLRGSENTRIGEDATRRVFGLIEKIVAPHIREITRRSILIENASHRTVLIEFASDPDILIVEKLQSSVRHIVSIEIKGGSDASNVHNRLGEAEKSHLKAKNLGCAERWTFIRVDLSDDVANRASPTTSRFFHLDRVLDIASPEHAAFRETLISRLGIRD